MNLKDLEGKHAGKPGLIVGSGPSLYGIKPESLKEIGVIFAVNSSISKMTNADYFICDDYGVRTWDYYLDVLPKTDAISLLYEKKLKGQTSHLNKEKVLFFNHKWWYDPKSKTHNPDGLVMTKNAEDPIIGARTAAGTAVHWAYIMGCDPIILVACDCCYMHGKRYYWQFPGERKCKRITGEKVFCHNNRGSHQGYAVDSHSMDFIEYWTAFAKSNPDANILDASVGPLNVFKKLSIEDLLNFNKK